jgi:hypothetical protein
MSFRIPQYPAGIPQYLLVHTRRRSAIAQHPFGNSSIRWKIPEAVLCVPLRSLLGVIGHKRDRFAPHQ